VDIDLYCGEDFSTCRIALSSARRSRPKVRLGSCSNCLMSAALAWSYSFRRASTVLMGNFETASAIIEW